MQSLSLTEISGITHGELLGNPNLFQNKVSSVITDSRQFHRGSNVLFIALIGPVNNGHHYISNLIEKGVLFFVVSDRTVISEDAVFVLVNNTTSALQNLAAYNRHLFSYPVVGITGSNGKTIVKEWLHHLLSEDFRIVRSPKSYNSQVGVPLSVLLMDKEFDLGIFEAGISQQGEMEKLAPVISPEVGIFTNIGDAHQEFFTSLKEKIDEKLLLFQKCRKLICRTDNPLLYDKVKTFCRQHSIVPVFWSTKNKSLPLYFDVISEQDKCLIDASYNQTKFTFQIPFTDESAIENACHCFATLVALDLNPEEYIEQFAALHPVAMRLEIKQGINNCILINDYYNSDLNSLTIALSALKQQAASETQPKILILSDIEQTGMPPEILYKKVAELLNDWKIDQLIGIGPGILTQKSLFKTSSIFYADTEEFVRRFQKTNLHSSAILIKGARRFHFEQISGMLQQKAHQTVLEINLNALVNNLNTFRKKLKPATKIVAMVKAFSYGSGDVEVARVLQYQKVDYLAVAVADEGVQLRDAGITVPIIVMNPEQDSFQNIIQYNLEPNIYSIDLLNNFADSVSLLGLINFPVHLKIDTGMNRLGFKTENELNSIISFLQSNKTLKIQSVFSHLAGSDEAALDTFTREQFRNFEKAADLIRNNLSYPIDRHILNSAGIERFPEKQYEMVRLGIGLYGVSISDLPLENIGTLKSTVSQIKPVRETESIGYNRKGRVNRESRIAVVPIGYADGLDRKLGNKNGSAYVNGKKVPIVGNICMDMLMLDVTDIEVETGEMVEFFGPHISINELALQVGTIPYEILTGISQRVKRVYVQE
ncbi:MAG TPA: bifunctional UDP-N-acetylmuramoyl-tripeptide:D-alanyl-D-alanine ligase/alanine racemase [Draconibacterium sp.]|nr:bifunctional UDP-N-acetylmuramoyl-tripeptide:D-alanyl-D-alanine ligase/alanine racemase [Draconibacterium sp.]